MSDYPRSASAPMVLVLAVGASFGAATSLVNALAHQTVDLESRAAAVGGWSVMEIVSILFDSGWAWAGLAVLTGWLANRAGRQGAAALVRGAVAGTLSLLVATAAYYALDTIVHQVPIGSYVYDTIFWALAAVLFGPVLGAIGACAGRPGAIGVLARVTVPVGAAVQMVVQPPGRNEVLTAIGQWVVWTAAAVSIAVVVVHFIRARPTRTA